MLTAAYNTQLLALPLHPAAVIKAYRPAIAALAVMHNLLRKKPINQNVFQNSVIISASDNNLA
ncbi:MAG: hypothetical protein B7X50_09805 [Alishewanella sp. 34-51-39]|nr:MAG: hypothetical protein B7X50_09805 [Alishewanella sp. 34-51-39]